MPPSPSLSCKTVAFVSFESEFAPAGGLAAVMRNLPRAMAATRPAILLTPFFSEIDRCVDARARGRIRDTGIAYSVEFDRESWPVTLLEFTEVVEPSPAPAGAGASGREFKIYFVETPDFFHAPANPYITPGHPGQLLVDSLFFSVAVAGALPHLSEASPFLLNLQDWETAMVARVAPRDIPHRCVLTLHNPYDEKLTPEALGWITNRTPLPVPRSLNVLQYSLPKVAGISTVSENYATELLEDPLQSEVLARQLQQVFALKGLVGINNGTFTPRRFPDLEAPRAIRNHKDSARAEFARLLTTRDGEEMLDLAWGRADVADPALPIFFLFGRDDPRQKGMDVAAQAIREVLTARGAEYARFIFAPIPGPHGLESLGYLRDLAADFPASVLVFPFRMSVGYDELQAAASYLMMASLYEPFGGATEGYAVGVPVIARATGGLVQQVCPLNLAELPPATRAVVARYHPDADRPTGFLFREPPPANPARQWKRVLRAKFLDEDPPGDALAERLEIPLFQAMVASASQVVEAAVDLHATDYATYARLVVNGLALLERFSWADSARKYRETLYRC